MRAKDLCLHSKLCLCSLADTLKELWISELLPEDRKLKSMKQVQ